MSRWPRAVRGFTLLEIMVASAISLIVLAATLWTLAELQRRGLMEESLMEAQNAMRVVREMLVSELQKAGTGSGSARLVFGSRSATGNDIRYAIAISPQEKFDGTGLFPVDTSFKAPTGNYATRVSDALQLWSWDTEAIGDDTMSQLGITPLMRCASDGADDTSNRTGNQLCVKTATRDLEGRVVMVVKPLTRTACIMQVKTVNLGASLPTPDYVKVTVVPGMPGMTGLVPATSGPCTLVQAPPSSEYTRFWAHDELAAGFLVPLRGVAFRVNWSSGLPVLERQQISAVVPAAGDPPAPWVVLSRDVELMRLRLGAVSDLTKLGSPVLWFPDPTATPPRPAIDSCKPPLTTCDVLVPPTKTWVPTSDEPNARDALMRRVRTVEVQVTTRTSRADAAAIRMAGTAFVLDADGNPQDGFKRRTSTLEVMPRNYAYAGVTP